MAEGEDSERGEDSRGRQCQLFEYKPGMSSTLVETVSINYEDFNDSFLTCGTCLCTYDGQEHNPKLLPCSHTVCRNCLERIAEASTRDTGTFRCPICRETITIPRGGVIAFPPSFIVNQLLDLMASQRRDVIPKCSNHTSQELLFCESCDTVFCNICTGGNHNGRGASEHTVIPFSIAIKRMSEILLYKAHLCIRNLNTACEIVGDEMTKLEDSVDRTMDSVNRSFQDLIGAVDKRRHDVLQMVKKIRDEKKRVLKEQLDLIQTEKSKVQNECEGLQYQVEVRNITKKIGDLNEKLDALSLLSEPRENAFMKFDYKHNNALQGIVSAMNNFGRIRISTTYPALSTAHIRKAVTHLKSSVLITTVDYHGNPRTTGGDPIHVELRNEKNESLQVRLTDSDDGTYKISYTAFTSGKHRLSVNIFDRPIKDSPFVIDISEHNNPVARFGSRGTNISNFVQPVNVVVDRTDKVYVLDTGNSRIKCLNKDFAFLSHVNDTGLDNQSGTGIAMTPGGHLVIVNWRTKYVTEISPEGELVNKFTSREFVEPINLAVNSRGDIIVADNGAGKLFVFNSSGRMINKIGTKGDKPGQFKLMSSIAVRDRDEIVVADNRLQVFSRDGKFLRQIVADVNAKGQYGGVTVDHQGYILATRTEKGRSIIQVFAPDGKFQFVIDSFDDKLKRPSGLVCTRDEHVVVVDLGNDCIKKYRYK
ncbi:tripartite motif-containing protein 2-like isoform X2 [Lineus longissimus]|uniref:tripartite motif-containing protein 2-like isoform X2 n=1 Tax=Lineus longissimus TaxID=88925 RepID=UPI002B4CFD5E